MEQLFTGRTISKSEKKKKTQKQQTEKQGESAYMTWGLEVKSFEVLIHCGADMKSANAETSICLF